MASTSTQSNPEGGPTVGAASSLPEASSHQLAKRQQYDALLKAEAGTSKSGELLGSPSSHPSFPAVAPLCRRYPSQASALFQTYLDLKNGAAAWEIVEPLALSSRPQDDDEALERTEVKDLSGLSDAEAQDLVRERLQALHTESAKSGPLNGAQEEDEDDELLTQGLAAIKGRRKEAKSYEVVIPLTISQHLRPSQLKAMFTLIEAHAASCKPGQDVDTSHVLLAIIAPDSTLVYYIVSQGMVKPIN